MRTDQTQRLGDLAEKVMDVFLDAADPSMWAGDGETPADMAPNVRGARNWDIKNANQAGALMARVLDLRDRLGGRASSPADADDAADADVARYEKQAKELLKRVNEKQRGRA